MNSEIRPLHDIQKLLPSSADAELGLLSSFMLSPKEVGAMCIERDMKGVHFHIPGHRLIFQWCLEAWNRDTPIDFITLTQAMRDRGALDEVGGSAFVTGLFGYIPTAANAEYYANILEEKRMLRDLIRIGSEYSFRAHEDQEDASVLVDEAMVQVCAIRNIHAGGAKPQTPNEMMQDALMRAQDRLDKKDVDNTLPLTGLPLVDDAMSGMRPGDYILISGKEKSGKSSLAFQIFDYVTVHQKKKAIAISIEMKIPELTDRMISNRGKINFTKILKGWMNEGESQKFFNTANVISPCQFQIRDDVNRLPHIVASLRQYKAQNPECELAVIDYLQLIDADKGSTAETREQGISHISRTMRRLASELNIAMIMLVQLNEDGQVRESRAPGMDCTCHIRIEPGKEDGQKWARIVYQRNGPSNVSIPLAHIGQFLRFEPGEFTDQPEPEKNGKGKKSWNN